MRKAIVLTMLLTAAAILPVKAQFVFPARAAQIQAMETGSAELPPDLTSYYTLTFRNKYNTNIILENKNLQRSQVTLSAGRQKDLAEEFDSLLMARAKVEAMNLTDLNVDLAYEAESDKIESALSILKSDIKKLAGFGGQTKLQADWNEQFKMLQFGYKVIHEACLPNSERHEQYLKIFADINERDRTLRRQLQMLEYMRNASELEGAEPVRAFNAAEIAAAVLEARLADFSLSSVK